MLYVKTKIQPSLIHGIGVFAEEFISKGTTVWKFTHGFDLKFTRQQILSFPETLQIYIYKYGWKSKKTALYCLSSDNGKYFNHSDKPNTVSKYTEDEEEVVTRAIKDIQAGEELTDNYSLSESDKDGDSVLEEIARKHNLKDELDPRLKKSSDTDYNVILNQVRKVPRVHGYISPHAETRVSPIHGLGLFANDAIDENIVVAAWGGCVTTKEEIDKLSQSIGYHYALELYPGFYLAERNLDELDSADFINHSCNPNCSIANKFIMKTNRKVMVDEELTADFSNHKSEGEKFVCNCGSKNCRKIIYFD